MAVVENRFVCDLSKPVQAQALKGNVFSLDNLGSRLSVLIYNNGQPANISGSVTASCILPDGSTVNVNGSLTTENGGSKAYVDVPQSCLLIPGILKIAIKCTSSSVITTLAAIVANVYMTKTDNVITPSQQIIDDWNAEISSAIGAQDAKILAIETKIGDTTLPTTAQTLTGAIAEHETDIQTEITKVIYNKKQGLLAKACVKDRYVYNNNGAQGTTVVSGNAYMSFETTSSMYGSYIYIDATNKSTSNKCLCIFKDSSNNVIGSADYPDNYVAKECAVLVPQNATLCVVNFDYTKKVDVYQITESVDFANEYPDIKGGIDDNTEKLRRINAIIPITYSELTDYGLKAGYNALGTGWSVTETGGKIYITKSTSDEVNALFALTGITKSGNYHAKLKVSNTDLLREYDVNGSTVTYRRINDGVCEFDYSYIYNASSLSRIGIIIPFYVTGTFEIEIIVTDNNQEQTMLYSVDGLDEPNQIDFFNIDHNTVNNSGTFKATSYEFIGNRRFTCTMTGANPIYFLFYFATVKGERYKLHLSASRATSINSVIYSGIDNKTDFSASKKVFDGSLSKGENIIEFVAKGEINIFSLSISTGGTTFTLDDCYLEVADLEDFVNADAIRNLKPNQLKHEYKSTIRRIYITPMLGDLELYYDGMIQTQERISDIILNNKTALDQAFVIKGAPYRVRFKSTDNGGYYLFLTDRFGVQNYINIQLTKTDSISNPGSVKNILMIGDSLTAGVTFPREFYNYLQALGLTNFHMLGRLHDYITQNENVRYEASGGYAWDNYTQNPSTLPPAYPNNYFWNPTTNQLDISYYFDTYCDGQAPSYIICNVGINHKVNQSFWHTFEEISTMCKQFLDAVHSEYPNCKIVLCGYHHGCPDMVQYDNAEIKQFAIDLGEVYWAISQESTYSGFVTYCDVAPYFDGRFGFQTAEQTESIWTTDETTQITQIIHPGELGYKMLAFANMQAFIYAVANNT